jgi:transcriptional regulator with XRE-family HTH domain
VTGDTANELDIQIGGTLRKARLARGYTQDELAQLMGVDRTTISKYESGSRAPSIGVLIQIGRLLGQPLAALVPGTQGADPIRAPRGPVQIILQVLDERPDLIPTVLELLEMALERERQTLPESRLLPARMPNE